MEKYLQIFTFLLTFIVAIHTKESDKILSTDVCEHSGQQLFCKSKTILKIHNVTCYANNNNNYTCPEYAKIVRLCDGQTSCSSIGLRQQFQSFCLNTERAIIITYHCVPVEHDPPCRTNICSAESEGLQCKDGNVIHILRALCVDGNQECSWKVYNTLYGVCETQKTCHASGLRPLMPRNTCDVHFIHDANVFIDYICIQDVVVDETCAGTITTMTRAFGIVKSPGFPNNPNGNPKKCYWAVYPARDQRVDITVHLAFSRDFTDECNNRFLQVTYTDCTDKHLQRKVTHSFCKASEFNIVRRSCGVAYIQNRFYRAGEDKGNRFVVSYEVKNLRSVQEPSYHRYRSKCYNGDMDSRVTSAIPFTDGQSHIGYNSTYGSADDGFHPWRFLTLIKVIVVNIFLFIIAVALIIAIIWVCYRYRQVSKIGKYNLSNQSDTDSGRRTNDTPLQTFSESASPAQGNSMHSFNYNERNPNTYASLHSEEPYATVDRSQFYPDSNIVGANVDSHGVTTFMSPRDDNDTDDHYASYSSLNYEVPHKQSSYSYPQNGYHVQDQEDDFPPPPEELQQSYTVSDNVPRYTINDDDYAIVQKPRKQQYNNINNHYQGYDHPLQNNSASTNSASTRHPNNRHNQFQPEVGFLPQHRCMLDDPNHVCNVPPFNPSRHSNNINHYHNPYVNPHSETDYY